MTLPNLPGIGFKPQHAADLLADPGPVAWLEIHAENYLFEGGPRMALLRDMAERFPISVHGVALSIGGEAPIDRDHLARVARLVHDLNPASFSEHLAWSTHDSAYFSDLLPLPYTTQSLTRICEHIDTVQEAVGRKLLLENPASYLAFTESTWAEPDFLAEIARRTGCGLLLDVANVAISAHNLKTETDSYLEAFALDKVGEIHLAGPEPDATDPSVLIDSHADRVPDDVWALFRAVLARVGPRPALIEWDNNVPDFAVLRQEAAIASEILAERAAA